METRGSETVKVSLPSPFTEDVIVEILSRSPVKLVLRSRCVSKDWYGLTKTHHFISIHQNSLHSSHPNLSFVINMSYNNAHYKHGFSLLRDDETLLGLDLPNFMLDRTISRIKVVGSSNGLVCLSLYEVGPYQWDVIVWNPATKQFKVLPQLRVFFEDMMLDNCEPLLGFGFVDGIVSGYKVVKVFQNFKHNDLRAQVLNQGADSWREVTEGGPSCKRVSVCTWITVKGMMYWLASDNFSVYNYVFSFDLRDEVFNVIPLPSAAHLDVNISYNFFSWKNSVAIFSSCRRDFWVMNEESAEMRWTKLFTFPLLGIPPRKHVFGVWKDQFLYCGYDCEGETGKINCEGLFLYDPTSKKVRHLSKFEGKNYIQAVDYMESLVPV